MGPTPDLVDENLHRRLFTTMSMETTTAGKWNELTEPLGK